MIISVVSAHCLSIEKVTLPERAELHLLSAISRNFRDLFDRTRETPRKSARRIETRDVSFEYLYGRDVQSGARRAARRPVIITESNRAAYPRDRGYTVIIGRDYSTKFTRAALLSMPTRCYYIDATTP